MRFGYDGDGGLGDRLLAAVLRGEKTATSSLAIEYSSEDPLPEVGERFELIDLAGRRHGMVETTRVKVMLLEEVGDEVAHDEGEGLPDVDAWRRAHETFWKEAADMIRAEIGDPAWELRTTEQVVVEWFRLLDDSEDPDSRGSGSVIEPR